MDLPTELRLYIAEYALVSQKPLTWYWSEYTKTNKTGSFHNIERVTALTRVCRQLYAETTGIVWKVNELQFQPRQSRRSFWAIEDQNGNENFLLATSTALLLFLQRVGPSVSTRLPSVVFGLWKSLLFLKKEDFAVMDTIAELLPPRSLKLHFRYWGVRDPEHDVGDFVHWFMIAGRDIGGLLARLDLKPVERKWRIFPNLEDSNKKHLEENLSTDMFQLALEWIEHGL